MMRGYCWSVGNVIEKAARRKNGFDWTARLSSFNNVDKVKACGGGQKVELLDSLVLDACEITSTNLAFSIERLFIFSHL